MTDIKYRTNIVLFENIEPIPYLYLEIEISDYVRTNIKYLIVDWFDLSKFDDMIIYSSH